MTLTWPDIPFVGTEVTAFVAAYKELAESIYADINLQSEKVYLTDVEYAKFKKPYIHKEFLKDLLESGLIYAAFIIQQRSGNVGPGIDFVLGNTPYLNSLTETQRRAFFKMLGCNFSPDDMKFAFDKNKRLIYPNFPDGLRDALINEMQTEGSDLESNVGDFMKTQTDGSFIGALLDVGKFLQRLWLSRGNKAVAKIPDFMDRYLEGTGNQWTEADFTPEELLDLKKGIQEVFDKGGTIIDPGFTGPIFAAPRVDRVGQFTPSAAQQFAWGMGPGDTAYQVYTYGSELELLLGSVIVVKDGNGNLKSIHDDYDFVYGYEINRSSDGNLYGEPFNNNQVIDGGMYRIDGLTHDQVQQQVGNGAVERTAVGEDFGGTAGRIGRSYIIDAHRRGVGKPFPVKVNLQ